MPSTTLINKKLTITFTITLSHNIVVKYFFFEVLLLFAETWRIAGPVLIILSLFCHIVSVSYCIAKRVRRRRRQEERRREKEESDSCEVRSIDMDPEKLETKCLLENGHDIACFPDSSLRYSNFFEVNTDSGVHKNATI